MDKAIGWTAGDCWCIKHIDYIPGCLSGVEDDADYAMTNEREIDFQRIVNDIYYELLCIMMIFSARPLKTRYFYCSMMGWLYVYIYVGLKLKDSGAS